MKLLLSVCFVMITTLAFSQDYSTGIGLRGGYYNGLTIKHFISEKAAIEGLFQSRWRGFDITGLYEIHTPAFNQEQLKFYYGGGAHIGFWNGSNVKWANDDKDYMVIGIDGIIGLEYSFTEIPFNLSLDWKPAFNLIGYTGAWGDGGALSVRYIF